MNFIFPDIIHKSLQFRFLKVDIFFTLLKNYIEVAFGFILYNNLCVFTRYFWFHNNNLSNFFIEVIWQLIILITYIFNDLAFKDLKYLIINLDNLVCLCTNCSSSTSLKNLLNLRLKSLIFTSKSYLWCNFSKFFLTQYNLIKLHHLKWNL